MGIKASNIVIKSQEVVVPKPVPSYITARNVESISRTKKTLPETRDDGKLKIVKRKSAFLQDMLSLDNEQHK
jgi:hypothetical protein